MKRLLVYSHDTFGLGNLRRMLGICGHLIDNIHDLSILMVTGSPMIQAFRLRERLDYIKLPCLSRTAGNEYSVKSLGTDIDETIRLRADLTFSAYRSFKPDVVLIDKKPYGVSNELKPLIGAMKARGSARCALILRDILDSPEATTAVWRANGYYEAANRLYDLVLVLGIPQLFDVRREYNFPDRLAEKTRFCGYIRQENGRRKAQQVRDDLGLGEREKLVLVTAGGGEDGFRLLSTYIAGAKTVAPPQRPRSLIISGPELPSRAREFLVHECAGDSHIRILEFTDDLMSYLTAADLIVSMGGYNTVCEILSAGRRAIVVPRSKPVEEQLIRAERMARLGLFRYLHPDDLTPSLLMETVQNELRARVSMGPAEPIDLDGLQRVTSFVTTLLADRPTQEPAALAKPESAVARISL